MGELLCLHLLALFSPTHLPNTSSSHPSSATQQDGVAYVNILLAMRANEATSVCVCVCVREWNHAQSVPLTEGKRDLMWIP